MSGRRPFSLVLCAVLLLGVAGACDRGGKAGEPRRGGVLRVGVTTLGSLDPAQARTVEQLLVADQLFDSLTAYDKSSLEPVPAVAKRWEVSPDQRQWDFVLRPDATFHSGRIITSADVKYSLERVARRGSGSAGGDLLEVVSGFVPFSRDGSAGDLAGITTPAPDVVHFNLDQPQADLASLLASPVLGVVPREAVEAPAPAAPFAEQPVGSGPFKMSSRTPIVVSLESARDAALLDGVEFIQFQDVASSYQAFDRGDLDWTRVPPERVEDAQVKYGDDGFVPYAAELLYGFNMRSPKFSDSRVREAILLAIDRRSIVRAVYANTVRPLEGIVVEGIEGHQRDPCAGHCRHDLERAKKLLAEARPGAPALEVALDYDDDVTQEAVAKAIQANLQEAGVNAQLRPKPLGEYQQFALSGQQELFRLGWIASYPSPDAFLSPLFATGSPSNLTGHSVPAVDAQLRAARAEPDRAKRIAQFQAAEQAVMSTLPVIPIAQLEVHTVLSPRTHGLISTTLGTFDASVVWLTGN